MKTVVAKRDADVPETWKCHKIPTGLTMADMNEMASGCKEYTGEIVLRYARTLPSIEIRRVIPPKE